MTLYSPEDAENTLGNSRRRSSWGADLTRAWFRLDGRIVRLLFWTDYSVNPKDGGATYCKRITHRNYPRGVHFNKHGYANSFLRQYAELPADQWVELVYEPAKPCLLLTCSKEGLAA